ncbi:TPA: dTDP-4-dehydrorhamnose reductase, partial [Patescibacteria group bacterium]|nr:dTDP-4-dehydrorhamnose reductase [Patescibacteria group bacterium]
MSSKVLILGSRGMLGTDLVKIFADKSDVVAWDREDIDVTQEAEVMSKIIPLEPQLIINATGYTNVDGAEDDAASAFLLNGVSVDYLVKAAASLGAKLIHFSTEYVFDGTNQAGYKED